MRICSFLLTNGHRCQCVANRGLDSAATIPRKPSASTMPPKPANSLKRQATISVHAANGGTSAEDIAQAQADQFADYIEALMTNMDDGRMSPRTAGSPARPLSPPRRTQTPASPAEELPQQPPRDPAFDLAAMDAYIRKARAELATFKEAHGIEPIATDVASIT